MIQKGFSPFFLSLFILVISVFVFFIFSRNHAQDSRNDKRILDFFGGKAKLDNIVQQGNDGRDLSNGKCRGNEKPKLTHLPMRMEDFSMIIPYGLVVYDHVTPIDHQYFSPTIFHSPRDTYEVYAMADAILVDVQPRIKPGYTEYRLVFSVSCKLFYYYDLVTSLDSKIKSQISNPGDRGGINIPIKAGQIIGRIGGQTLDFAVWDMDVTLKGFITPELYKGEPWKIHTVDPLDYYSEELRQKVLSKYIRLAPPISGKIDYDIYGKLVGNWFVKDTNGYEGIRKNGNPEGYSRTHLAIVPNHIDPTVYMISFGNFDNKFRQFAVKKGSPDPTKIGVKEGLVKYELFEIYYIKENGQQWNGMEFAKNITASTNNFPLGCAAFQLVDDRSLKIEAFPNKSCDSVSEFSSRAVLYER